MLGRYYRYSAVVRPWLWFLTRTADCRIFQEMTVPDIVKKVFGDHATADFKFELTGTLSQVDLLRAVPRDRLQLRQPADGAGRDLLLLPAHRRAQHAGADRLDGQAHAGARLREALVHLAGAAVRPEIEHITQLGFSREIQPGVYVHDDYDFERPSVELKTKKALPRGYSPSDYEVYDYPGHYVQKPDGEQYAAVRIDEFGAQFETRAAVDQRPRLDASARCFTLGAPRATIRTANTWLSAPATTWSSATTSRCPKRAARATAALRGDVERAAVPARADHAEAVRAGAADRGRGRARAARRSTPTSTAG